MKQSTDDVMLISIAIVYILFTLLIQFVSELWLYFLSNTSLPKSWVTNLSLVTKAINSLSRLLTTVPRKTASPSPVVATRTSEECTVTTGSPAVVTTVVPNDEISKDGTTCHASKILKSGPSTQSASRQVKTKSSRTTKILGFGSCI